MFRRNRRIQRSTGNPRPSDRPSEQFPGAPVSRDYDPFVAKTAAISNLCIAILPPYSLDKYMSKKYETHARVFDDQAVSGLVYTKFFPQWIENNIFPTIREALEAFDESYKQTREEFFFGKSSYIELTPAEQAEVKYPTSNERKLFLFPKVLYHGQDKRLEQLYNQEDESLRIQAIHGIDMCRNFYQYQKWRRQFFKIHGIEYGGLDLEALYRHY